jgi:hypothetical protein
MTSFRSLSAQHVEPIKRLGSRKLPPSKTWGKSSVANGPVVNTSQKSMVQLAKSNSPLQKGGDNIEKGLLRIKLYHDMPYGNGDWTSDARVAIPVSVVLGYR